MKKISELTTQSFLGGTNVPANSDVLINYADSNAATPVTKKVSVQELGKAIANDLKLPSVTVSGNTIIDFKVKGVSNGAYTEKAVGVLSNDGPSMGDVNTAISGLASTGYVTDMAESVIMDQHTAKFDVQSSYLKYYSSSGILSNVTSRMISGAASTGYVDDAVSGLASTGYVTDAVNDFVSMTDIVTEINDSTTTFGRAIYEYVTNNAGAGGGGGFNPTTSVPCLGMYAPEGSDAETENLYPAMAYGQMICTPDSDARYFSPLPLLYYEKDGTDLKLKDEFNNTLCTLTGVISNS